MCRAVRWVYDNIEYYGGNPKQLTISGHSAGAHLVSLLVVQPSWLATHELTSAIFSGNHSYLVHLIL